MNEKATAFCRNYGENSIREFVKEERRWLLKTGKEEKMQIHINFYFFQLFS